VHKFSDEPYTQVYALNLNIFTGPGNALKWAVIVLVTSLLDYQRMIM